MNLEDFKILPATVIDVNDPKYIGRIKVDSPGLFDSSVMNKEGLPWVYPISMGGYQGFSTLRTGSKVWVMTNKEYHEFWYWPMFELNQDTRDIISGNESDYSEAEVLISRNSGENGIYIYYSPSEGIVLKNSSNTFIKIKSNNEIEIKAGKGNVVIKDNIVYNGVDDGNYEKGVLGDSLKTYLTILKNYLEMLQTSLKTNPYTSTAAIAAEPFFTIYNNQELEKLLSSNVSLN